MNILEDTISYINSMFTNVILATLYWIILRKFLQIFTRTKLKASIKLSWTECFFLADQTQYGGPYLGSQGTSVRDDIKYNPAPLPPHSMYATNLCLGAFKCAYIWYVLILLYLIFTCNIYRRDSFVTPVREANSCSGASHFIFTTTFNNIVHPISFSEDCPRSRPPPVLVTDHEH